MLVSGSVVLALSKLWYINLLTLLHTERRKLRTILLFLEQWCLGYPITTTLNMLEYSFLLNIWVYQIWFSPAFSQGYNICGFQYPSLADRTLSKQSLLLQDGWMTSDFASFSTVFQSYQDDGISTMKDFASSGNRIRTTRSVGQCLTHWATGAPHSYRKNCY